MSDLISRQAAIDAVRATLLAWSYMPEWRDTKIIEAVKRLPPIQPKRGKWNRLDMDTLNCNKCGATFVLNQGSKKMHFCPNCGADMRGEQDG